MNGIILPFTIYLRSALGFSALKAGLTLAPSSLVMIAVVPFPGRRTDKTGGKYILVTGLSLFSPRGTCSRWTMVMPSPSWSWPRPAAWRSGTGLPARTQRRRLGARADQMAGTISSPGSSGQSPGSSSGTAAQGAGS